MTIFMELEQGSIGGMVAVKLLEGQGVQHIKEDLQIGLVSCSFVQASLLFFDLFLSLTL